MTNKHNYNMGFALHAATASKDTTKVGAVLVGPDGEIRLTGYNGPPKGVDDKPERFERPAKYLFASHAEQNVIAFAAREGIKTNGCKLYVTHLPCSSCMKSIIQAGIICVVYGDGQTSMPTDEFTAAQRMASEAGVQMVQHQDIEEQCDDIHMDAICVSRFVNDLKNMTNEQIATEINNVGEDVDRETSWLEALCAEQRIRMRKS